MLIITRYFSREFLKIFLLCMASFVALYLLVDLFDRMDDMLKHRVSLWLVIQYCLCSIPMIIYQVSPLAVLLCTFITIGNFVRHHEITALKAGGVSLFSVLKVFFFVSCCLCVFSIWLQEYVLPYTNSRMKVIKNVHIKGKELAKQYKDHQFWYRSGNSAYNIEFFNPDTNTLNTISIMHFNENVFMYKRIDAKQAVWVNDTWHFTDGVEREFTPDGHMTVTPFKHKLLSIAKTPDDFKKARKEGDEMGISEIRRFIKKIKKEGYPTTSYVVDMHAKISYAFINVIMAILGIPFALRIGRSGGMAMGITISILLGFLYWTFFAFCLSLGKGGTLAPFVSAWIANVAFGSLGLYMFLQVRQ